MIRFALLAAFLVAAAAPVTPPALVAGGLQLSSETLTLRPGARSAIARGNVVATSPTMEVRCEEAEATYAAGGDGGARSIETLVLREKVVVRRHADNLLAEAGEATYDRAANTLTLSGDPVVKRGADVLRGERIVLGLADESLEVERARVKLPRRLNADPLEIKADRLVTADRGGQARFDGHVQIVEGNMGATADHAEATLDRGGAGSRSAGVSRVVLSGHVQARRDDQRGTADRATYDAETRVLLLEGKPTVEKEGERLTGDRILLDVTTGQVRVEKAALRLRSRP